MNTTLPRDSRDAANYREWRQEWLLAVIRCGYGKATQAVATALYCHAWAKTENGHERGTYTFGHLGLARVAGIMPESDGRRRRRAVSDALTPLRKGGWIVVEQPGNSRRGMNGMVRLTAPNDLTPVELLVPENAVPMHDDGAPGDQNQVESQTLVPGNAVPGVPGNAVPGVPENAVPSPCTDREQTVDETTSPHPRGEGAQNHTTEEHTDFDHFTAAVEKQKRWELSQHCDRNGEDYQSMLDEFISAKGCSTSKNWVGAFKGFVNNWSQTHNSSRPSRPPKPSQGTAPVADATPAAPSSPAPVIDAVIVDATENPATNEETTINPLSFRALFTADPRPGMARCLSALSTLQKAGITDEEIHRAHKAGRMDEHPNPDDCAERIIRDRDTITADCPF